MRCLRKSCGRYLAEHGYGDEVCPDGRGQYERRLRRAGTTFNEREVAVLVRLCEAARVGVRGRARAVADRHPREFAALERKAHLMQMQIDKLPVRS